MAIAMGSNVVVVGVKLEAIQMNLKSASAKVDPFLWNMTLKVCRTKSKVPSDLEMLLYANPSPDT